MNILNSKRSYFDRMKQCYVPFDACYGLCSDSTVLFLPPSRTCLGILSKTLPSGYPLEFNPSEYFSVCFEDGSSLYCRSDNGFKGFYHWVFDVKGRAILKIDRESIEVLFLMEIVEDELIRIEIRITNNTPKCIKSMYLNPCLRYNNQKELKGYSHENVYLSTDKGFQNIPEIIRQADMGERILFLHHNLHKIKNDKWITTLLETLLKARAVKLSDYGGVKGETITCMSLTEQAGILLGFNSQFGFFSRSKEVESGCIHTMPLIENLEPGKDILLQGILLWGKGSVEDLQQKYMKSKKT